MCSTLGSPLSKAPAVRVLRSTPAPHALLCHPGLVLHGGAATGPRYGMSPGLCPVALARKAELVWGVWCQGMGTWRGLVLG